MEKIIIAGSCGSGKSSLGKDLSRKLNILMIDLDDLFWLPHWTKRPQEEFFQLIAQAADQPRWIICGNQSKSRALFWPKADTVIWLDLPFHILLGRILKRSLHQMRTGEWICNGNQQTLTQLIWLIFHLCRSYRRHRLRYARLKEEAQHLQWIHLKSTKEVNTFIHEL